MDMSKVHVWIGINYDEDFDRYFELNNRNSDMDIDDPEYSVCQFCKDINERWYDEDLLCVYIPDEKRQVVDIDVILKELTISEETFVNIKKICVEKGVEKANMMFYYMDPICYLEHYPDVNDDDEEIYPDFVTKEGLRLFYSGEHFEGVIHNALFQKNQPSVDEFIAGLNYYRDYDSFLGIEK